MALSIVHLICFLAIFLCHSSNANPPILLPFPENLNLRANETFYLSCGLVTGSEISFEWTHNGVKLVNSSNVLIESSSKFSSLTFPNVHPYHSGHYECRATNSHGESTVTKTRIHIQGTVKYY